MKTFNEDRANDIKENLEEIAGTMRDCVSQLEQIVNEMGDSNAKAYLINNLKNLVDKETFGMMSYDLDIMGLIERVDEHIEDEDEECED